MRKLNQLFTKAVLFFLLFVSISAGQNGSFTTVHFTGKDGVKLTADLYDAGSKSKPMILLFHMFKSSRGEYRDIAPKLVKMGFNCLAVDTRGGDKDRVHKVVNETVQDGYDINGRDYLSAYPDLESSLQYVKSSGYNGKILVWGSSYTSILVFKLAAEHQNEIAGLLSFSPGEYIGGKDNIVEEWASEVKKVPCYVSCAADEKSQSKPIFDAIQSKNKTYYLPHRGTHGSPNVIENDQNWKLAERFLKNFLAGLR